MPDGKARTASSNIVPNVLSNAIRSRPLNSPVVQDKKAFDYSSHILRFLSSALDEAHCFELDDLASKLLKIQNLPIDVGEIRPMMSMDVSSNSCPSRC